MHALLDIIARKFDSTFKRKITPALASDKEEFIRRGGTHLIFVRSNEKAKTI
jgi:hypothetical protein